MPIKDKNNNILTTEREQYLRWKEHFQEVLNQKDPDELAIIPEASVDLEIDTDPPSKLEIQKDIKSLKNKKTPGTDQLRDGPFNFQRGVWVFSKKKYSDSQCC